MKKSSLLFIFVCLFLLGCKEANEPKVRSNEIEDDIAIEVSKKNKTPLVVQLINQDGDIIGEAILEETKEGVLISTEAKNLPPGLHGYHIHEQGRCEPPTFEAAGGHFNPNEKDHGFDHENGPHAGDLPNLNIDSSGTVKSEYLNDRVTLEKEKEHSLLGENGSTLIIHSDPDDYISQPAGNAGERIACGIISEPQ